MDKSQRLESYVNHFIAKEIKALSSSKFAERVTTSDIKKFLEELEEKELGVSVVYDEFFNALGESGILQEFKIVAINGAWLRLDEKTEKLIKSFTEQSSEENYQKELKELKESLIPQNVSSCYRSVVGLWFYKNKMDHWKYFFANKLHANSMLFWYKLRSIFWPIEGSEVPEKAKAYLYMHMTQFGFRCYWALERKAYLALKKTTTIKAIRLENKLHIKEIYVQKLVNNFKQTPSVGILLKIEYNQVKIGMIKNKILKSDKYNATKLKTKHNVEQFYPEGKDYWKEKVKANNESFGLNQFE